MSEPLYEWIISLVEADELYYASEPEYVDPVVLNEPNTELIEPAIDYGLWARNLKLNAENFHQIVEDNEHAWVVSFMNPFCSDCKKFVKHWDHIQHFDGIKNRAVNFAFVDIRDEEDMDKIVPYLGDQVIRYTPTVLFFGRNKNYPSEFLENLDYETFYHYVVRMCDENGYSNGLAGKEDNQEFTAVLDEAIKFAPKDKIIEALMKLELEDDYY